MAVEVRIPSLGESVSQGVIARWLKENGETVAVDDVLFELETDKATMEIPAEAAGRLEILKAVDAKDAQDIDLRITLLDIFRQRGDSRCLPYLWHLSSSSMYPAISSSRLWPSLHTE